MPDLNTAVTLIRTGQRDEAQAILKEIIRTEPHNIPAWFWMVETLETDEDKLRVMEVCRKLNPEDTKVHKAYEMLKEVQAADAGEKAAEGENLVTAAEPAPAFKEEPGVEKEIPAAPFAEIPVIQAAPEVIIPPAPVVETPEEKEMSPVSFAAIPVIHAAAEKLTPPPPTPPVAPLEEEKPSTPPFKEEVAVVAAASAAPAAPAPAFEPAPAEPAARKPRRKRNWKWLIPAIIISFVVFFLAGLAFKYLQYLLTP